MVVLSPALFVLVLDFALRGFEIACSQLGVDVDWLGYADDLVLMSSSEQLAQQALHQLQAACAFVGLFINVGKTECLAVNVRMTEVLKTAAVKERVLVRWGHAEYAGWLVDWSGRTAVLDDRSLAVLDMSRFALTPPSHLLTYDDGEVSPVMVKKGGWLMDSDGDKHRFKLCGFRESLDASQNKFRCDTCSTVFATAKALAVHMRSQWCRKKEDLSEQQMRHLRHTRYVNEKRMGIRKSTVEQINILDIDGNRIKAVGEFKYLGTVVCNKGGAVQEVTRRIQSAALIFSQLKTIWNASILPLLLKVRLFLAVVASVLLYNSECWAATANDVRLLEGFYFRCLRHLTRSTRCPAAQNHDAVDKASKIDVFRVANVPTIEALLQERRLRWLGHVVRCDPQDTAWKCLMKEVDSGSVWWKLILSDLRAVSVRSFAHAERLAADRTNWRTLTHARPGLPVLRR